MMTGSSGYKYFKYQAYTMYISIIVALITVMVSVSTLANASVSYAITNSTSNVDKPLYRQIQELIENPYFAPDGSCVFDTFQLHCIPGENQECPKGFGNNEDDTCFRLHRSGCPEGYHGEDGDETGQCYPDTEPCYPGQIRYPSDRVGGKGEACGQTEDICKKYNQTLPESCFIEGRSIVGFPTSHCISNPDQDNCAVDEANTCPENFSLMRSANFTVARCVPINVNQVFKDQQFRDITDPNRCGEGYELGNVEDLVPYERRYSDNPIGNCAKQN
jgi:hypothetical protein